MRRCIGLDVHREFAEVAIWEDGLVRSAGQVKTTPEAPTYWIATVWPPLPRTEVWTMVWINAAGPLAALPVAGAKLTLPVDWPSTRICTGQAWSAVGVAPGFST